MRGRASLFFFSEPFLLWSLATEACADSHWVPPSPSSPCSAISPPHLMPGFSSSAHRPVCSQPLAGSQCMSSTTPCACRVPWGSAHLTLAMCWCSSEYCFEWWPRSGGMLSAVLKHFHVPWQYCLLLEENLVALATRQIRARSHSNVPYFSPRSEWRHRHRVMEGHGMLRVKISYFVARK